MIASLRKTEKAYYLFDVLTGKPLGIISLDNPELVVKLLRDFRVNVLLIDSTFEEKKA